jgi:FkbM family methyltransferase
MARSLVIYWRPGRQHGLRRLYRPFVAPGELVFDVGAHLGDRTRAFASLGARVVALEPQPRILAWLLRLVGRKPGVVVRGVAVGAEPGTAEMAVSRRNPTVSTLADRWRERISRDHPGFRGVRWEEVVEVPVTTLDELIREFGLPTFCKIDVEGFEAEVLAGLSHPLAGISVEFVSGGLDVAITCVRRLEELGGPAGGYEFNAVSGEVRIFHFPSWQTGDALIAWFDSGAEGLSSGDLYARLRLPADSSVATGS